eukprot:Skav206005  [mRNA]  locus=scaffold2084:552201:555778:- [translate_table: standard]
MPSYEDALTAFSEARSLLARAEDAMQHAVQVEQQKNVDLRRPWLQEQGRELTEAREAQRKAVAELSAARDAQEKAEGRVEKLEEKLQAKRDAIQELTDAWRAEQDVIALALKILPIWKRRSSFFAVNRDLKEEVEELEDKVSGQGQEQIEKRQPWQPCQRRPEPGARTSHDAERTAGDEGTRGPWDGNFFVGMKENRKSKSRGKSSNSSKSRGRKDRSRHSSRERSRRQTRRRRSRSRRSSSQRSRSRYRGTEAETAPVEW